MVITNTNVDSNKVNYFDLNIRIVHNRYHYKSYEFNFQMIRNLSGNVPCYPSVGVFTSQLYRYCSINLIAEDFKNGNPASKHIKFTRV